MGPLSGIKVIELAGIGPAPFCGMLLADLGADVVVAERPPRDDDSEAVPHFRLGAAAIAMRGKRSIAMDLRHASGPPALLRLIARADVLIEGFRPGVMERLGLGPEPCLAVAPKLIYGRMTGWGQTGPLARTAGHDLNYIALAGALACGARDDGRPWAPPSVIGDMGGGLLLAFGIACAVVETQRSGRGQVIDAAMIDAAALLTQGLFAMRGAGVWSDEPGRNLLDSGAPFYDVYQCSDGRWVSLAAIEPRFYRLMLAKLGLEADPLFTDQFDTRRWPEQKRRIAEQVRSRSSQQWAQLLEGTDACFAPVLDMKSTPQHPHNLARSVFTERDGIAQPAPGPRFSRTPGAIRSSPPKTGEHTEQVLLEAGFSHGEIEGLRSGGVVA